MPITKEAPEETNKELARLSLGDRLELTNRGGLFLGPIFFRMSTSIPNDTWMHTAERRHREVVLRLENLSP